MLKGPTNNVRFTDNESIDVTGEQRNSLLHESVGQPIATEMTQGAGENHAIKNGDGTVVVKDNTHSKSSHLRGKDEQEIEKMVSKVARVMYDKDKGVIN